MKESESDENVLQLQQEPSAVTEIADKWAGCGNGEKEHKLELLRAEE